MKPSPIIDLLQLNLPSFWLTPNSTVNRLSTHCSTSLRKLFRHMRSVLARYSIPEVANQGTIAQIRAGEPEPSFNLRGLTINVAPLAGSWSRFAIFSM